MKITKTMMTRSLLAIAMIFGCATSAQADMVTLLVDYQRVSDATGSTNADFLSQDSAIDATAVVNVLEGRCNPGSRLRY